MSYLFVFRAYPDIDHMAPLAWKLLEGGEEVHAIISPGYDPAGDHHLALLRAYERFHLTEVAPRAAKGRFARLLGTLRGTLPYAMAYVLRHRIRLVAVEWGYGLRPSYDHAGTPGWAAGIARSLAGSIVRSRARAPQQPRASFIVAGRLLGRSVVCLPHGLSVKLDAANSESAQALVDSGALDWSDRNRFDAYVINTEHHRRNHLAHAKGDDKVMQTWGSVRWSPAWFDVNRRLAPRYEWPAGVDQVKVVFMVPKWKNKVDGPAVISLLRSLAALEGVSVAVKGHPRPKDGSADPLRDDPTIDWTRLHDAGGVDSVSLIAAADVVLDVGSSIGLEVVMQEKVLVNPAYLHGLTTLFDEIEGTCVVAHDDAGVAAYLRRHAAGDPFVADPDALVELLRRAVYGDRREPYDVLDLYDRRIRALAEGT